MDVRGILQFTQAHIESLTFQPAEKDPTASLVLSAALSPELAQIMRCREAVFTDDAKPHPHVTRLDLGEAKLRDIDLSLPHPSKDGSFDTYRPELIYGFRVEVDGMLVRLHMRARVKGRYDELVCFLAGINKDDFDFAIRSLQEEFDWSGKGGTGTQVALSDGRSGEVTGPLFADAPSDAEETTNEPALPAMHIVGSGRGPKKQRTRGDVDVAEAEDAEPVFPVN